MTSANKPGNQFVKQDDVISKSSVYPTIPVFFDLEMSYELLWHHKIRSYSSYRHRIMLLLVRLGPHLNYVKQVNK